MFFMIIIMVLFLQKRSSCYSWLDNYLFQVGSKVVCCIEGRVTVFNTNQRRFQRFQGRNSIKIEGIGQLSLSSSRLEATNGCYSHVASSSIPCMKVEDLLLSKPTSLPLKEPNRYQWIKFLILSWSLSSITFCLTQSSVYHMYIYYSDPKKIINLCLFVI